MRGKYTSRAWTEWTQGFQVGSALLQFDATGEQRFLEIGRRKTIQLMAPHVSHMGVHDHGFNNISTYGNLWRLMREGKIPFNEREKDFYELALKVSGAVQAARWSKTADGGGYIYSFNGPHSLFVDTVRSLRSLAVAHQLGHVLRGERDESISLLERLLAHAETTALYSIYYGKGRDAFDVRGRTAHESIFNLNDGSYRCPNSQQGYSPFSTWTRGLAWAILGLCGAVGVSCDGELVERSADFQVCRIAGFQTRKPSAGRADLEVGDTAGLEACATPSSSKPPARRRTSTWQTPARTASRCGTRARPSCIAWGRISRSPPTRSTAGSRWIARPPPSRRRGWCAWGIIFQARGDQKNGERYRQAGLTVANTLFDEPYLSTRS